MKNFGNKPIGKIKYPKKTSFNLLVQERSVSENPKMQIAVFVLFILILLVFVKFMVVDKLAEAYNAQSNYEQMESEINQYKEANSDYDKVREEYSHYGNGYLNDQEAIEQDRLNMMNVIDKKVLNQADMQTMDISGNVATLTIDQVRLRTISSIVAALEADSSVSYVSVSTAGTNEDSNTFVTATMTINFNEAGGEE